MKVVKTESEKAKIVLLFDWLIHMLGYTIILILASIIFKKTVQIDSSFYGVWALITAIIIFLLNRTIKPVLIWLTLPITGITMGLFYPFVNVIILNITDFIMGNHFQISGIFMSFLVAIFISILNILMDNLIIKPIIRKER